jgi:hypothetical protein
LKERQVKETARREPPVVHRLEIGKTYANRDGAYEVLSIDPPKMTIRYENGRVLVADIATLVRIWENLQAEAVPLKPEPRAAPRRTASTRRSPRTEGR